MKTSLDLQLYTKKNTLINTKNSLLRLFFVYSIYDLFVAMIFL